MSALPVPSHTADKLPCPAAHPVLTDIHTRPVIKLCEILNPGLSAV
jgi:hypothetical protein